MSTMREAFGSILPTQMFQANFETLIYTQKNHFVTNIVYPNDGRYDGWLGDVLKPPTLRPTRKKCIKTHALWLK